MVFSKSQTKHDASNRSQCMHPKQNERAIRKTKALLSKRKPSNRFVMHPPGKSGCIFSAEIRPGDGGEGNVLESFIFSGAFAVLH